MVWFKRFRYAVPKTTDKKRPLSYSQFFANNDLIKPSTSLCTTCEIDNAYRITVKKDEQRLHNCCHYLVHVAVIRASKVVYGTVRLFVAQSQVENVRVIRKATVNDYFPNNPVTIDTVKFKC